MEKISVAIQSADPLTRAGLLSNLQEHPGLTVLPADLWTEAAVRVVATERLRPESLAALRRSAADSSAPVVLIVEEVSEADLLTAVECRVVAVLPRAMVSGDRLARAIQTAVTGGGVLPPA